MNLNWCGSGVYPLTILSKISRFDNRHWDDWTCRRNENGHFSKLVRFWSITRALYLPNAFFKVKHLSLKSHNNKNWPNRCPITFSSFFCDYVAEDGEQGSLLGLKVTGFRSFAAGRGWFSSIQLGSVIRGTSKWIGMLDPPTIWPIGAIQYLHSLFLICPLSPFLPTLKKGIQPVPTVITE